MCRVLIIEDEEAVRGLLTEAFSLSGTDVFDRVAARYPGF